MPYPSAGYGPHYLVHRLPAPDCRPRPARAVQPERGEVADAGTSLHFTLAGEGGYMTRQSASRWMGWGQGWRTGRRPSGRSPTGSACGTLAKRPSDASPCTALAFARLRRADPGEGAGSRIDRQWFAMAHRAPIRRPHPREARHRPRSAGRRPQPTLDPAPARHDLPNCPASGGRLPTHAGGQGRLGRAVPHGACHVTWFRRLPAAARCRPSPPAPTSARLLTRIRSRPVGLGSLRWTSPSPLPVSTSSTPSSAGRARGPTSTPGRWSPSPAPPRAGA